MFSGNEDGPLGTGGEQLKEAGILGGDDGVLMPDGLVVC